MVKILISLLRKTTNPKKRQENNLNSPLQAKVTKEVTKQQGRPKLQTFNILPLKVYHRSYGDRVQERNKQSCAILNMN